MMKRFMKTLMVFALILSLVLPVLTPIASAAGESSSGLKDYHSMTMEEIFACKEDLTWVITGDSITHNGSWTQGMNSYSEWFEQYLYDVGRGDDAVYNTGWGGADIRDFLYYKDTPNGNGAKADPGMGLEQFITKYNPDVVTIKLGMNNRGMTTAEFVKYYKLMLDSIYAEGKKNGKIPKVVILTPTPMSGETIYDQDQVDQDSCWRFQKCLKEIAEEYDLLFVDLMTAFTTEATKLGSEYRATFFVDPSDGGIHPNAAGHYLIYKTFSKVLGIYDESLPMYSYTYDELKYAPLWEGGTGDVNLGAYDAVITDDLEEMGKTMPSVPTAAKLLSYVEFTKDTGLFNSSAYNGAYTVDLTDATVTNDTLTLDEVKAMGKEFTLIFRAKLDTSATANQPILTFSTTDFTNWNDAFVLGVPGTSNNCYYEIRSGGSEKTTNANNNFKMDGTNQSVDGNWHTIAIVQSESAFTYYVDGVATYTSNQITIPTAIGDIYAGATQLAARIGLYVDTASSYILDGCFDYWAFYDGAMSKTEIAAFVQDSTEEKKPDDWSAAFKENNLWAVAGAEQMSGYQGTSVYRSLFRLLDNTIRNTGNTVKTHRDIRLLNAAAPGYTVAQLNANYEALIGEHNAQVFLLLPEVSEAYADGYVHSADKVSQYKDAVNALIAKAKADKMTVILWTPLASNDATVNDYLDDYATAVREIAAADSSIFFFDANNFMNYNMKENAALLTNWFEEDMYISPLCALDLARSFFSKCQNSNVSTAYLGELTTHNLRDGSDKRTVKGPYLRNYIASAITVDGTQVTVDVSDILAAHPGISNLRVAILPEVGYGNYSDLVWDHYAAIDGSTCTFTAPWSNCVITIYGELDGKIYRFKDHTVSVSVSESVSKPTAPATDLTDLKVVGAPAIDFKADTTTYTVHLYQYQNHVQIIGIAAAGQLITVNGEEVLSGNRSQVIDVDATATVTVKANGKTYTLTLVRPEYPDIIITEVMQDTAGEKYDMLEIYNASGKELDLKDYSIGFKKDYSYASPLVSGNQWPYYFAGNDTGFHSTSSSAATQTGINPITKYSTYAPDGVQTEPESIPFPANSTMVIWVRRGGTSGLTYQDLINDLTEKADTSNYDNKTLQINGVAVVPGLEQLVVAEVPNGAASGGLSVSSKYQYGYLENHGAFDEGNLVRTWLFILGSDAVRHHHNAVTAAGDDIFSAALLGRVSTSQHLSTVLYYDVERGMSVVKDAATLLSKPVTGYVSSQSGYMNLTTFGAVEYWQKPLDLDDATAPSVQYSIKDGKLTLTMKDNSDVRYFELNLDLDGDGVFETVINKDLVLESSAASATGTPAVNTEYVYTHDLGKAANVKCYGYVLDGNNNKSTFGAYGDLKVSVDKNSALSDKDKVSVEIQVSKGEANATLDKTYDILDAQGNVIGKLQGAVLSGTVELSEGQTVTVKGLPAGVKYQIRVSVPEGFEDVQSVTGTVTDSDVAAITLKVTRKAANNPVVKPTDPENPGEPEEPTVPSEPEEPGETVEPTEPAEPTPTEPSNPGTENPQPTDPVEPEQPTERSFTLWKTLRILAIVVGVAIVATVVAIVLKSRKNKE